MFEIGMTQTKVTHNLGVALSYVNRINKGRERIVNKRFVRMMDELSYNVELMYRKKEE